MFTSLDKAGTRFAKGQLCLICAAPGVGKSAFVLTYALKASVPTLYCSADSDAQTQLSRSVSILTGQTTEQTSRMVREERLNGAGEQIDALPIMWETDAATILFSRIEEMMEAFKQKYGDYPSLVVVDNITNVRAAAEAEDPFEGLESLMDALHKLARDSGACVLGLHHVTGHYNNGDIPIPLGGIKGQLGRVPETIITLHRSRSEFGPELLNVSTVKNRSSKADPSGNTFVSLAFDGKTMSIRDLT